MTATTGQLAVAFPQLEQAFNLPAGAAENGGFGSRQFGEGDVGDISVQLTNASVDALVGRWRLRAIARSRLRRLLTYSGATGRAMRRQQIELIFKGWK